MKKIIGALVLLCLAATCVSRAEEPTSSETLVWCGLDYSKIKMIGTLDFNQPEQIFPGMLDAWNGLFMKEMLPRLEKISSSLKSDLKAVEANNQKANANQILKEDGTAAETVNVSHITEADIVKIVQAYNLKNTQGVGLVFVIDRLVKAHQTACLYVVFFDIQSRKVLLSQRLVEKAGGYGFRNYWFRPVKAAVDQLPKLYKKAKKQQLRVTAER